MSRLLVTKNVFMDLDVLSDAFFWGDALRILRNVHRQMWMWNGSSADVVSKNVLFKRALEAAKGQSDE